MQTAPTVDLSAIPAAQRAAVQALMETVTALKDITRRQENVIAELNHAQFEALFAGLDWRKVKALDVRPPAAAE